jgi:hypothetical protein
VALVAAALVAAGVAPTGTSAAPVGEGITLVAADGPNAGYVDVAAGGSGNVSIALGPEALPAGGGGLNPDAVTRIDDLLALANTNDRRAFVYVTDGSDALTAYAGGGRPLEGPTNEVRLGGGERVAIGLAVDTRDRSVGFDTTLTIHARVSELVSAALDLGPTVVEGESLTTRVRAGRPIGFDASNSTGDDLRYAFGFDGGATVETDAPRVERTFSEPGNREISLTTNETSGAPDDGADTLTREFVVIGEGATATVEDGVATATMPAANTTGLVRRTTVSFDEPATGTVRVSTVATESLAPITGSDPNGDPVAGLDVTVPPAETETDANLTIVLDAGVLPPGVDDPTALTVERYDDADGGWETLEPEGVETNSTDGTITIQVGTPGFSTFAVTTAPADGPPTGTAGGPAAGGPTDEDDDPPTEPLDADGEPSTSAPDGPSTSAPDEPSTSAPDEPSTPAPDEPSTPSAPADGAGGGTDTATEPETPAPTGTPTATPAATPDATPPGEAGGLELGPAVGLAALLALLALFAAVRRYRSDED